MTEFKSKVEEKRYIQQRMDRFNRRTHHYSTGKCETVQDKLRADKESSMAKKSVHYNTDENS
ncbi:MAG TPA: hypothetical protein ENH85_09830 [Candidatus Scalindua sp.]|nr:hypothetical protein [Candidatus Scalindua sp.]